jgi:hypothetical protein
MDWMWTWGGECFGYRNGHSLFTYFRQEVGRFHNDEIYGSDGRYLGEIKSRNRFITRRSKSSWVKSSFAPRTGGSYARYANYAGYAMYAGYEHPYVLRSRSQLIRRCWLQFGAVMVQLEGAGCKCNPNVTINLAKYYRNHPKRSLIFIVVAAVLIGLVIDVIAEGIESHNDRVLHARITESQSEMRLIGAQIAQMKDHDFESMAQYIQVYARIGPLVNDYDQKLQKYSDLYRSAEERDQHRSVIHFGRQRSSSPSTVQ